MNRSISNKTQELISLDSELRRTQYALNKAQDDLKTITKTKSDSKSENDKDSDSSRFVLLNKIPDCLMIEHTGEPIEEENEFIDGLKSYLEKGRLSFSTRTLLSYHTALKVQDITPLTVLAGVSGTGKSLLPTEYAKYAGFNCLTVPVQPRWDSPQDLLGFYNFLENRYIATDLSRLLWAYDKNKNKYDEEITVVLLDEMNLARTEYYFSEFLSKLEFRRSNEELGKIALSAELSKRISIHKNILFVGTMNEDESTQTLSDKVLDRANVLRFGCPDLTDRSGNRVKNYGLERKVFKRTWNQWCDRQLSQTKSDFIDTCISELNDALNSIGKPFGFRVRDAIRRYVSLYPNYYRSNDESIKDALADQIELKILPKLRGLDMTDNRTSEALSKLKAVIDKTEDFDLINAFNDAEANSQHLSLFIWNGITRKNGNM